MWKRKRTPSGNAHLRSQNPSSEVPLDTKLPDGLILELARDKRAMQRFSALTKEERDRVVARARAARTRADLRLVVLSLSSGDDAREFY